mmetsp:Transcript_65002/g.178330  ORF Transcript_65002/g.178330 Transcript_65002/m.178330 type:complete len:106 (+) Transcript_65002:972-1289(+)
MILQKRVHVIGSEIKQILEAHEVISRATNESSDEETTKARSPSCSSHGSHHVRLPSLSLSTIWPTTGNQSHHVRRRTGPDVKQLTSKVSRSTIRTSAYGRTAVES